MSDPENELIQVFLLGRFEIVWGRIGLHAADWTRRKAATLMQRLALEQRLPKEKVIDFLWPNASRASGSNNLYRTIYALRQVLNEAFGPEVDGEFFSFVNGVLYLNNAVWVDAVTFKELAGGSSPSVSDRQQAHTLYKGDLLPAAPYSDWLLHPRESLWRLHRENSLALAGHFESEQAYDQAIPLLVPLLAHDPLDEVIHRELMRLYALSGQCGIAIRQYHICAQTLKEELDVEPEEETEALLHAIKSKQIAPPPSPYPTPTAGGEEDEGEMAPPRRHNLPAFPDSFVGRQDEIETIHRTITQTDCRLLTLHGIGGIGKTRLAVQAATALIESAYFPDGLFFVNLAGIESADYFVAAIADALNFPLAEATDPLDQIIGRLRTREILLILDNFEHLQSAAPQLSVLLRQCPHLKVIVTSRHQLNLAGEFLLVLDGLPLLQKRQTSSVATQLFLERARQFAPDFDFQANRLCVNAICQLVAGMPLAIEMCAAWTQTLSCYEILTEIKQGLDILEAHRVDAPDRHLSIRAVFQASLDLLTPVERRALLSLAVFRGTFTHDAARKVADATLPQLRSLVEKSLLRVREESSETRYQMHPLLHQFARETAETRRLAEGRRRQACYFADLLAQLAKKRCTLADQEIVSIVFMEVENLRSVWRWLGQQIGDNQQPEVVCQLLNKLLSAWSFAFFGKSRLLEGKQLLNTVWEPMVAAQWETAAPQQQTTYASVTIILGRFCRVLNQLDDALCLSRQGITLLEKQPDLNSALKDYIAYALRTWGRALMQLGNGAEAEAKLKESLELATYPITKAGTVYTLGLLYMDQGDYDMALQCFAESEALCHQRSNVLTTTIGLGNVYSRRRQFKEAVIHYRKGVRLARRLGQKGQLMVTLNNLAFCMNKIGRSERIEEYYEEALAVATELGMQRWQAIVSQDFGMFLLDRGQSQKAVELIQDGIKMAIAYDGRPEVMAGLLPLAHWQAQNGRFEEAMVTVGYMLANDATTEDRRSYAADLWDELSSELPPVFTQRAEAKLETATLDDILAMM